MNSRLFILLVIALCLTLSTGTAFSDTIRVPYNYNTIQRAIDNADEGDTVLVSPDTYYENLRITQDVVLIGSPDDPSQTVIDGYQVYVTVEFYGNGITHASLISGFTLQNGISSYGGGLLIQASAEPRIENLIIQDNASVDGEEELDGAGGGLYLRNCDRLSLKNCTITNNWAYRGGGGVYATNCDSVWIDNCDISHNEVGEEEDIDLYSHSGGGVAIKGSEHVSISNSKISYNSAIGYAGAVYYLDVYSNHLERCQFYRNHAEVDAGAIFFEYPDEEVPDNLILHCSFVDNSADNGGAVLMYGPHIDFEFINCIFWNNSITQIYCGGEYEADLVLSHCLIEDGEYGYRLWGAEFNLTTEGIIDVDPLFVDPENDDYHLSEHSPCIDRGDPNSQFDEDGTVADIGVFPYPQYYGEESEWHVQVKASSGFWHDDRNYAGGAPGCTDEYDNEYDLPNPPEQPDDWIDVFFPHPEWNHHLGDFFSADFRAGDAWWNDYAIYNILVGTSLDEADVELSFDFSDDFPENANCFLVDFDNQTFQNIKRVRRKTVTATAETYELLPLLVGSGPIGYLREGAVGWQLVSIPAKAEDMTPSGLFGDDYGETPPMYGYHRARGYEPVDECISGYGYWLGASSDISMHMRGYPRHERFERQLNIGINLIGTPFNYTEPLEDLWFRYGGRWNDFATAVEDEVVIPTLLGYSFNGEAYGYSEEEEMKPFYGYWMYITEPDVRIRHNFEWQFEGGDVVEAPARDDEAGWEATLNVRFGNNNDNTTHFGYHSEATDGYDRRFDHPEPPTPPSDGWVSAFFEHDDWSDIFGRKYNSDIRAYESDSQWELIVKTDGEGEATLTWDFPVDDPCSFRLYDTVTEEWIEMAEGVGYTYESDGSRDFLIEGRLLSASENKETLPLEFNVTNIAPNPFNSYFKINYDLPVVSDLTISLYDLQGRNLHAINYQRQPAGSHTAIINGVNLASGVYWLKVESSEGVIARKVTLIK